MAALSAASAAPALGANTIFWTTPYNTNDIYYANLDGSSTALHTLSTKGATANEPWGVAPDPATGRVYWANYGGNTISYANLNGTGGGDLNTTGATVSEPLGVVVDQSAGKIYWANVAGNKISWANLNGTGGGDLNTGVATVNQPVGVAIDLSEGKIYWANYGAGSISWAMLDGTGGGDLDTAGAPMSDPLGVTIDRHLGKIYWGNTGSGNPTAGSLDYANLNGTGGGTLSTSGATQSAPMPGAIDPSTGEIYWANLDSDNLSVAKVDGDGGHDLYTTTSYGPADPGLLTAPVGTGAPKVTASSSQAPATLSCSKGRWAANDIAALDYRAPRKYAYAWTRNGKLISGATSSKFTAESAASYACRVTATNFAGATKRGSAAVTIK